MIPILFKKAILELLKEALVGLKERITGPAPALKPVPVAKEKRKPHPFAP
ncbi:MAG: hypothetical protein ACNA8K_15405 [Cyclonatronaceae bacterium]